MPQSQAERVCNGVQTDPSPVPLRLAKAPERDTLSLRERVASDPPGAIPFTAHLIPLRRWRRALPSTTADKA
jgi:hypothetical protein